MPGGRGWAAGARRWCRPPAVAVCAAAPVQGRGVQFVPDPVAVCGHVQPWDDLACRGVDDAAVGADVFGLSLGWVSSDRVLRRAAAFSDALLLVEPAGSLCLVVLPSAFCGAGGTEALGCVGPACG